MNWEKLRKSLILQVIGSLVVFSLVFYLTDWSKLTIFCLSLSILFLLQIPIEWQNKRLNK